MWERIGNKEIWKQAPGNPVLRRGPEESWDAGAVLDPCVAAGGEGYLMWYAGRRGYTGADGRRRVEAQVGLATSADGLQWSKREQPVFTTGAAGEWDSAHVYNPFVIKAAGQYRMYYHGDADHPGQSEIGMAVSADGVTWRREPENPILRRGRPGEPDDYLLLVPNVLPHGRGFAMIYCQVGRRGDDEAWSLALAVSEDGMRWNKAGSILSVADEGKRISSPTVVKAGERYYLWAWIFDHARMDENEIRLYCSTNLRNWEAVWDTGWKSPWARNDVSRRFFMPRVFRVDERRLLLFFPMREERGICDTGLAVAEP